MSEDDEPITPKRLEDFGFVKTKRFQRTTYERKLKTGAVLAVDVRFGNVWAGEALLGTFTGMGPFRQLCESLGIPLQETEVE